MIVMMMMSKRTYLKDDQLRMGVPCGAGGDRFVKKHCLYRSPANWAFFYWHHYSSNWDRIFTKVYHFVSVSFSAQRVGGSSFLNLRILNTVTDIVVVNIVIRIAIILLSAQAHRQKIE